MGSLGSCFQLLLLEGLVLLKDILSQLVDAGRERKQNIRVQACSLAASGTRGTSTGSDVLVSLQGFLTELLSCLFTMPASMALPQLA